ncbi:MAG: diphosphate--fructose-6-phosphate 1-phosphotransferase [Polyangiaceae bacterium]
MAQKKIAILVGGGPAPGINSVIGAATIRSCLSGYEVLGIQEGFKYLIEGDTSHVTPLTISDTSRIHFRGGSTIGIARANPTKDPKLLAKTHEALKKLDVGKLITIGGDDTAFSAYKLAEASGGDLAVVHVPKTIDNDLDLPYEIPTFGYQTARHIGVGIVQNLMVDARTTGRWYFVIAMGRKAGHLALGIGKAAGATLSLIPEEFQGARLSTIVDTLTGAILKRLSYGRNDGVAVLAEGLVEILPESDLAELANVERDEHGHIRIAEINFGDIIKHAVEKKLVGLGVKTTIVAKNIGYELRCADPIPFDMEYTRDLGYCAARYIIEGGTNALVTLQNGHFRPMPFAQIMDPQTGRMRVRMVDVDSTRYRIAHSYMLRLKKEDFADEAALAKLATAAKTTPAKFREMFESVVANERPLKSLRDSLTPMPMPVK